jgi:hypothetical protein
LSASPLRRLSRALSWIALGADALAAVVGAVAVAHWGWALAMGLAVWGGRTTEPVRPDLPFPWTTWALCLAVGAAGVAFRALAPSRPWTATAGWLLAHGGVLAAFALPLVHLAALYRIAVAG